MQCLQSSSIYGIDMKDIKVLITWDCEDSSTFHVNVSPDQEDLDQVRVTHLPEDESASSVAILKVVAASFIGIVDNYGLDPRLTALAKTAVEEASMWAVKSVTSNEKSLLVPQSVSMPHHDSCATRDTAEDCDCDELYMSERQPYKNHANGCSVNRGYAECDCGYEDQRQQLREELGKE